MKRKIINNSPVIISIAAISCITLILGKVTNDVTTVLLFSTYRSSLLDPFTYVRMICHIFGHADINHLSGNMMLILLLGPLLEENYGSKLIIYITLLTAILCSLANFIFFPETLLMGASGVAFSFIVLSSITSNREGNSIPLTFIIVVILFIGKEIIDGLFTADNISHLSHIIGGFLGGVIGNGINRPHSKISKGFHKFDKTVDSFTKQEKLKGENGDDFTERFYKETKKEK